MKTNILFLLISFFLLPLTIFAQDHHVIIVRDSTTKENILGYSLYINGEAAITVEHRVDISDFTPPYEVKISHVGYQPYSNKFLEFPSLISVDLIPSDNIIQEVTINTGYQKIGRERLTGAVDILDENDIQRSVSSNIINRLEDMTTSISFDRRSYDFNHPKQTDGNLDIRGISSLNSSNKPLIVLDNFPYEGDIANINPQDIENISILKDASAASIWGSRAGNGVIVITTKRGKKSERAKLNFSTSTTIASKPDLFRLNQTGSAEFIEVEKDFFSRGFYDDQINDPTHPALSPVIELLRLYRESKIEEPELAAELERMSDIDIRDEYMQHFYRKSVDQRYAVDVSGGSSATTYYVSLGYDLSRASLKYNSDSRITFNSALDHTFNSKLNLHTKVMYTNTRILSSPNGYGSPTLYPYAALADDNGTPTNVNFDYSNRYLSEISEQGLLDWGYRPLQELQNSKNLSSDGELLIDLGLDYKIWKGIAYRVNGQFSQSNGKNETLSDLDSYAARNLINLYTQTTDGGLAYAVPMGAIFDQGFSNHNTWAIRNQFTYEGVYGRKHRLTGILGNEVRSISSVGDGSRLYGYDESTLTFSPIDMVSWFPTFDNLRGTNYIGTYGFYRDQREDRFVSFYGNMAYTLSDRYNLYVSARKDASNLFGVETNNKWTPLWSLGASWDLSKESFVKDRLNGYLKIRASYGYSGNVNNTVPSRSTLYQASYLSTYGMRPFAEISNPPNPSLRWERVRIVNFGIDFSFANERITGSVDLYQKRSLDLIATSPIDPTSGVKRMMMNSANTSGSGIDLNIGGILLSGPILWKTNILASYNKVMVTKYMAEQEPVMSSVQEIDPIEGYPAYAVFSYKWGGLDPLNGDPQGFLGEELSKDWRAIVNNTEIADLILHGSARPRWFGAFRNDFTYKKLTVSANLAFRFSYFFRKPTVEYSRLGTWSAIHGDFIDRWQNPGDEEITNVPSVQYPNDSYRNSFYGGAEINVEKGDHIRFRDIRIAYRFDDWIRPLNNIEIFAYATNLGFLWRATKESLDPDMPLNGIGLPRTFSFGLRINL